MKAHAEWHNRLAPRAACANAWANLDFAQMLASRPSCTVALEIFRKWKPEFLWRCVAHGKTHEGDPCALRLVVINFNHEFKYNNKLYYRSGATVGDLMVTEKSYRVAAPFGSAWLEYSRGVLLSVESRLRHPLPHWPTKK